jgi:hypothetical protein
MEQTFTCPDCGRQATYRPEECALLTRYDTDGNKVEAYRFRLVYCPG